jgi:tripeptidyl-peptidase-2
VSPRAPLLNGTLYEAAMEGQLYYVFDANKQIVAFGDVFSKTHQLKKGSYTIRMQVRLFLISSHGSKLR